MAPARRPAASSARGTKQPSRSRTEEGCQISRDFPAPWGGGLPPNCYRAPTTTVIRLASSNEQVIDVVEPTI